MRELAQKLTPRSSPMFSHMLNTVLPRDDSTSLSFSGLVLNFMWRLQGTHESASPGVSGSWTYSKASFPVWIMINPAALQKHSDHHS